MVGPTEPVRQVPRLILGNGIVLQTEIEPHSGQQHQRCQQVGKDARTGDEFARALAHERVVGRNVRLALGAVDDQRLGGR